MNLRALVRGDAAAMRKVHGALTLGWLVMIPVSFVTGLVDSVPFVVVLSEVVLVLGSWSSWQAARAGEDVVEAIVADDRIPTDG